MEGKTSEMLVSEGSEIFSLKELLARRFELTQQKAKLSAELEQNSVEMSYVNRYMKMVEPQGSKFASPKAKIAIGVGIGIAIGVGIAYLMATSGNGVSTTEGAAAASSTY